MRTSTTTSDVGISRGHRLVRKKFRTRVSMGAKFETQAAATSNDEFCIWLLGVAAMLEGLQKFRRSEIRNQDKWRQLVEQARERIKAKYNASKTGPDEHQLAVLHLLSFSDHTLTRSVRPSCMVAPLISVLCARPETCPTIPTRSARPWRTGFGNIFGSAPHPKASG